MKDLRVYKTKKAIKDAFIKLVKENTYAKVTVKDIANEANINRNTFYLHYSSKDDLVDSLLNEILISHTRQFVLVLKKMSYSLETLPLSAYISCSSMIIDALSKDIDFYSIISKDNDLNNYLKKLSIALKRGLFQAVNIQNETDEIRFEYFFNGFFGVIQYYFMNPTIELEKISEILGTLTADTYHSIHKDKASN